MQNGIADAKKLENISKLSLLAWLRNTKERQCNLILKHRPVYLALCNVKYWTLVCYIVGPKTHKYTR